MPESKYRFCKICGFEAHGSDREKHVLEAHDEEMDVLNPSGWFYTAEEYVLTELEKKTRELREKLNLV